MHLATHAIPTEEEQRRAAAAALSDSDLDARVAEQHACYEFNTPDEQEQQQRAVRRSRIARLYRDLAHFEGMVGEAKAIADAAPHDAGAQNNLAVARLFVAGKLTEIAQEEAKLGRAA